MPLGAFRLNSISRYLAVSSGRTAVTVTAFGDAQISTAQSKFGGASAYFNGTDATALSMPLSTDWDMTVASGPRTFELWVRPDNITDSYMNIIQNRSLGATTVGWRLGMTNADGTNGELQFIGWDSSYVAQFVTYGGTLSAATWHHIAIVWDGVDTYKIYLDGTLAQTSTSSTIAPSTRGFFVGDDAGGGSREWVGYMDELRVSNTARYTTTFTPPTSEFVNDSDTVLLLHMNGTNGSTTFLDDNGAS